MEINATDVNVFIGYNAYGISFADVVVIGDNVSSFLYVSILIFGAPRNIIVGSEVPSSAFKSTFLTSMPKRTANNACMNSRYMRGGVATVRTIRLSHTPARICALRAVRTHRQSMLQIYKNYTKYKLLN